MSTSEVESDSLATTVHWYIYQTFYSFSSRDPICDLYSFRLSWNDRKLTMEEDQKMAVLDRSYKVRFSVDIQCVLTWAESDRARSSSASGAKAQRPWKTYPWRTIYATTEWGSSFDRPAKHLWNEGMVG